MNTPESALKSPVIGSDLLDAMMAEHAPAVIAYAEKILRDRHLAEDIAQEAFIRAWPHTERLCSTMRLHPRLAADRDPQPDHRPITQFHGA